MKHRISILVLVLVMVVSALFVVASDFTDLGKPTASKESFFAHLSKQKLTEVTIESDFSGMIKNRDKKVVKDALLILKDATDVSKKYPIEIRLRGKSRRELCDFPPLKLKFSETLLKMEGFKGAFDDYKLVTHCMNNSASVLKEFLAYQLYNQLTEFSFRVHLLEVTYVDRSGEMEPIRQYGFLLENYSEMASRLNAKKMPGELLPNTQVPIEDYQRLALFQYMIGNTDWNLYRQHNIKWLRIKNGAIPVPYDFDSAGLIDAPYAKPHPSLPIASVRERFLQYRGTDFQALENRRTELVRKQLDLFQIFEVFQFLGAEDKQKMLNYLNEFFTMDQLAFTNHKPRDS
ncbi:MAG: hypothetical protein Sapg2KO_37380 [Saprospiraceae bacterium]